MNGSIHTSAKEALDKAINAWPRREAVLKEIIRLQKEATYGPLIRRIYELIPDSAKPFMDHYFFFDYSDKSQANGRYDFAEMFEERLWSGFGLHFVSLEYATLAGFGYPDEESFKKVLIEMNTCWDGILCIFIIGIGSSNGEIPVKVPISISPENSTRDKNTKSFFENQRT